MSRLESQWQERSARREEISREVERLGIERARLLADNIELDRKAAALAEQVLSTESQVNRTAEEAAGMRTSLAAGEENLKAIRIQVDEARERRSHIEVELVKLQAELKFLDETSRKELNVPVDQLTEPALDDEGVAEAERLYQELSLEGRVILGQLLDGFETALAMQNEEAIERNREALKEFLDRTDADWTDSGPENDHDDWYKP